MLFPVVQGGRRWNQHVLCIVLHCSHTAVVLIINHKLNDSSHARLPRAAQLFIQSLKQTSTQINKCGLLNSRNIASKLADFQSFVYTCQLKVICVTETWLSEWVFDKEILPSHYAIYRKDRGSHGGGVLVAVDESIPSSLIDSPPNLEIIVVQLGLIYPIILCTVYIPPNSSDSFDTLIPFLTDILSSDTPCFIVGDFNLPDICWSTLSGFIALLLLLWLCLTATSYNIS